MYTYHFRPGYGSDKFLIEFLEGTDKESFLRDLKITLREINPKIESIEDLWMNDEVWVMFGSDAGDFTFSKDTWGCAFIMSDTNQEGLKKIDHILCKAIFLQKKRLILLSIKIPESEFCKKHTTLLKTNRLAHG